MGVKPLHDRIIVRKVKTKEKTTGGIYIPEDVKDSMPEGTIVSVGPGNVRYTDGILRPLSLKVDDIVIFSEYAGTEINVDGESLLIMREDDILAIKEI
jgi:chaperonin GroES